MKSSFLVALILLAAVAAWAASMPASRPNDTALPCAWEYQVISPEELLVEVQLSTSRDREAVRQREAAATERLNQLGADGWELVTIAHDHYYFKRVTRWTGE